jgi:hypothetical protein
MVRWKKILVFIGAGLGCILAVSWAGSAYLESNVATRSKFGHVKAEDLDREVRNALPVGSSLDTVEAFLRKRGFEPSFEESSKTVNAIARETKGSNFIIESLAFQFHFDEEMRLTSIDSKVYLTGP